MGLRCLRAVGILVLTISWGNTGAWAGEFRARRPAGQDDAPGQVRLRWIRKARWYGPGDYGRRIIHGGRLRFYELHVPPNYRRRQPTPVILVFHGGGGHPGAVRYESGMDRVADQEGFIAVYPAGTPTHPQVADRLLVWNDGRPRQDGSVMAEDDVGFVAAVLEDLKTLFHLDAGRVYAAGYSNGAQFCYRLAQQLSDRIASIAVVAGQRMPNERFGVPPRAIAVMQFSGLKDTIGPYAGGQPSFEAAFQTDLRPVEETIAAWAAFDACADRSPAVRRVGHAIETRYGPCRDETEVILWTLEDGGHTWPGGRAIPLARVELGPVNRDINASELMWEFFQRHPSGRER